MRETAFRTFHPPWCPVFVERLVRTLNDSAAAACVQCAAKQPEGCDHRLFSPKSSAPKAAFGSKNVKSAPAAVEATWCHEPSFGESMERYTTARRVGIPLRLAKHLLGILQ
jgi:hypothetical protein